MTKSKRVYREIKTFEAMIKLYCRHHHAKDVCKACGDLLLYSQKRIEGCPFEDTKPACNMCSIHCFNEENKRKIRSIMAFSGPKMILHHPVLAIFHLFDKSRNAINRRKERKNRNSFET